MAEMTEVTKDKLIADVKLVIADSEELLRATAGQAGDKIAEIRARTQDRLAAAKIKARRSMNHLQYEIKSTVNRLRQFSDHDVNIARHGPHLKYCLRLVPDDGIPGSIDLAGAAIVSICHSTCSQYRRSLH